MPDVRSFAPGETGAKGPWSYLGALRVFPWIFRIDRGGKLYN